MRLFFDFEFTGLHRGTTPISLGIVAENFYFFYAEFTDYSKEQIEKEKDGGKFIKENVLSNLILEEQELGENDCDVFKKYDKSAFMKVRGTKEFVSEKLKEWIDGLDADCIEMWGDCLHYDWVLFLDLFGYSAFDLPEKIYYIPFDICTLFKAKGVDPDINREEFAKSLLSCFTKQDGSKMSIKHNALHDADVIMYSYQTLMEM